MRSQHGGDSGGVNKIWEGKKSTFNYSFWWRALFGDVKLQQDLAPLVRARVWTCTAGSCPHAHARWNRDTQPNLKWVKLSQTVVNKRCLLALLGHRNTGHHFCIVRTHKNMQTHTRIYTHPAPTSSNSYTHSFQKNISTLFFSSHTFYFFSFSRAHTEPQITSVRPALPSLLHNSFGQLRRFLSVVSSHESSHQTEMPPFILLLSVSLCHTLFLLVCVGSWGTLLSSAFKITESPIPYICSCSF